MDFTNLITAIVGVVFSFIAIYAIPFIKLKINTEQLALLHKLAYTAVTAAQQLGLTKVIKDKFEYAYKIVTDELKKRNIVFDEETIRAAIEAAVIQNFPK